MRKIEIFLKNALFDILPDNWFLTWYMAQIIIFLSVFSSIILWTTYGCLILFTRLFTVLTPYSIWIYIFGLVSSTLFIGSLFLSNSSNPPSFLPFIYKYGAVWIGVMVTILMTSFLALFVALLFRLTYTSWWHAGIFIGGIIVLNIVGLYISFHPRIIEYTISLKWEHNWHGKKIVMIADTHYGNIYNKKEAKSLVNTINTIAPNIVLIPWDFFDGPTIDFTWVAKEFSSIKAPYGILFSNGNHEEYRNTTPILAALEKANIKILNNKKLTIEGINFIGVTYHDTETISWLQRKLESIWIDKKAPNILLKHKPTLHKVAENYGIDVMVSGHSHKGQMFPFSLIAWSVYGKYVYGINTDKTLTSITTSGVWTWWPPQRIGTRGEIVVITIQ
jgi:uncharacterized protein